LIQFLCCLVLDIVDCGLCIASEGLVKMMFNSADYVLVCSVAVAYLVDVPPSLL